MRGWLLAFLFTQAIEVPIYAAGLRGRWSLRRAAAAGFAATAITHPVVWFVMPVLADALFAAMAARRVALIHDATFRQLGFGALAEGFAVAVEAAFLAALRAPRPLLWAFVANLASASAGYLSWRWTGWP